jgi:putative heme iron utilization protein
VGPLTYRMQAILCVLLPSQVAPGERFNTFWKMGLSAYGEVMMRVEKARLVHRLQHLAA